MKLVFQIAIGVFIGALASQYAFEQWRSYEAQQTAEIEQKKLAEQKRLRDEQGAKIRELLMKARRAKGEAMDIDEATLMAPAEPDQHKAE
ncbi:MAG: hypothetical protein ACREU9_01765 [Gammaproteobacteria bacterium]